MDPDRDSEHELVERLRAGDVRALEETYRRHGARIYRVCRYVLGSAADAEDAVQEVFLKVFERARQFEGTSRLSTWLHRIAVNHCLNFLERERVRRATRLDDGENELACPRSTLPIDVAGATESKQRLESLLARLPTEHRSVLVLREIEGQSYRDIAETLSIPVGTVMSRLARAREKLARFIGRPRAAAQESVNGEHKP